MHPPWQETDQLIQLQVKILFQPLFGIKMIEPCNLASGIVIKYLYLNAMEFVKENHVLIFLLVQKRTLHRLTFHGPAPACEANEIPRMS